MTDREYAGFWIRVGATLIDAILLMLITVPLILMIYGAGPVTSTEPAPFILGFWDVVINYVFPAIAVIAFWYYRSATPGKMLVGIYIADAQTGQRPSLARLIGRYLAYFLSALPLALGFIWVGIDKQKRGWHDSLAGTVVLKHADPEENRAAETDSAA